VIRLLPLVLLALKAWMVVDAVRRRAPSYWIWIIIFLPGGGIVYFFLVKMEDFRFQRMKSALLDVLRRPPPVDKLRFNYSQTPSLDNQLSLAQGLYDGSEYGEAAEHFAEVLKREADNRDALLGLGLSRLELDDHAGAIETLSRLVKVDKGYAEYKGPQYLAHAQFVSGQTDACLATLEKLVEESPRMSHRVLLAHYLAELDRVAEARDVLSEALVNHKNSPGFVKRRNLGLALQARKMLKQLPL
jgi:hypothetical protein